MQRQAQSFIPFFRMVVLAVSTALLVTSAALSMRAQNSVPPTARQAATMPRFASRLAPHATQLASRPNPAGGRRSSRSSPPQSGILYDNGPINGTIDAWGMNDGIVVSNTMTIVEATSVNGMIFGAWLFPGDVLQRAEISITSSEFGGTTYFDGVVEFTQSGCSSNQLGYNVCTATSANFSGPNLAAGTYWVNLSNAVVNDGDPVYWDENSGVGCTSGGCPSQASENMVGTIPSESFTVLGNNPPPPECYSSQENLHIIYDFANGQGGSTNNGLTIDNAGNLYGTNMSGGNNGVGLAFRLAYHGGWLLDPLFSFLGGDNGGSPNGVIVGRNGTLYGGAQGGLQNCNAGYCGLVFNLTPHPTACMTALCGWTENVPYRFSSESDGALGVNVSASDQEGNLYGTTWFGGAFDAGTVFELTPTGGGWTKTTLYSFTGGNDGSRPTQVLVGNDGNLYGVAGGGMFFQGVVFQLMLSGGQWKESVLVAFNGQNGASPGYLVQDGAGNLYGISTLFGPNSLIFVLEKTGSGFTFSEYDVFHDSCEFDVLNNLTIDAAGNLYGTGATHTVDEECGSGYVFKASYNGAWHYEDLVYLNNQTFPASGSLALDNNGNLYGTTFYCGTNDAGTVWQLSP